MEPKIRVELPMDELMDDSDGRLMEGVGRRLLSGRLSLDVEQPEAPADSRRAPSR